MSVKVLAVLSATTETGETLASTGTPANGVTLLDAADMAPGPIALVALTVNVVATPTLRPVTAIEVQGATQLAVRLPGDEVAV